MADSSGHDGRRKVVYLGDYIDRGHGSKEVLDLLLGSPLPGFESIYLLGNHEQAMLDFLEYPRHAANWLNFGGLATLLSYGARLERVPGNDDLDLLAEELKHRIPETHLAFLKSLQLHYQEGSYLFVHAGIRPGVRLGHQDPYDLLWIRDDFRRYRSPHEYIVVHGHDITGQPEILSNRIGIDTGAYYTGILTCLVLEDSRQRILQTSPPKNPAPKKPDRAMRDLSP